MSKTREGQTIVYWEQSSKLPATHTLLVADKPMAHIWYEGNDIFYQLLFDRSEKVLFVPPADVSGLAFETYNAKREIERYTVDWLNALIGKEMAAIKNE